MDGDERARAYRSGRVADATSDVAAPPAPGRITASQFLPRAASSGAAVQRSVLPGAPAAAAPVTSPLVLGAVQRLAAEPATAPGASAVPEWVDQQLHVVLTAPGGDHDRNKAKQQADMVLSTVRAIPAPARAALLPRLEKPEPKDEIARLFHERLPTGSRSRVLAVLRGGDAGAAGDTHQADEAADRSHGDAAGPGPAVQRKETGAATAADVHAAASQGVVIDGGPLRGKAALKWDMQVLAEEQALIQPLYSRLSPESLAQLNRIARKQGFIVNAGAAVTGQDKVAAEPPYINGSTVPGFNQPDMKNIDDRWRYGMGLGNQFTPGGTGFNPATDTMPTVGAGYQDGSEFARVDNRHNLHELDAWLNPNRLSRTGSGSDIQAIINVLSTFEKQQVLTDHSPDGWAYSIQFAQFSFVTEAMVRQALPSDPAVASQVGAFVSRFKTEQNRVQIQYPTYPMMRF